MGAVKDLYYDIETLFIEGLTAKAIALELKVPLEYVNDVLADFGVEPEDFEEETIDPTEWDVAFPPQGDYDPFDTFNS
jgi:hypothetical protein